MEEDEMEKKNWILEIKTHAIVMHAKSAQFDVCGAYTKQLNGNSIEHTHLYGISLRLLWLCECGTLFAASLTPQTANSCADPVKLRSLPR